MATPRSGEPTASSSASELDAADRRLLNALQQDSSRSLAELAEATGLTPQTCHRRLQRLRKNGVILREVAIVDPRRSEHRLTVLLQVLLERLTEAGRLAFERKLHAMPEVSDVFITSGDVDYVLLLRLKDTDDYYRFVQEVCVADESVKHFKSIMVLRRSKNETAIPF